MANRIASKATVLYPVKLPVVVHGQRLESILLQALRKNKLTLSDGDVVVLASKIVSTAERRIIRLDEVEVSGEAARIARKWHIDRRLTALVLKEADAVLGGVPGFMLTIKNGILAANAGIDLKNCPAGTAVLWPRNADVSAWTLRKHLERRFRVRLGVVVVDSRVTPLRLGTVGLAIGVSGFRPVRNYRGSKDLFGRKIRVTQTNTADDLAASAHLLMGEASEGIGMVVIRNAPILLNALGTSKRARLNIARCLIASNLRKHTWSRST